MSMQEEKPVNGKYDLRNVSCRLNFFESLSLKPHSFERNCSQNVFFTSPESCLRLVATPKTYLMRSAVDSINFFEKGLPSK